MIVPGPADRDVVVVRGQHLAAGVAPAWRRRGCVVAVPGPGRQGWGGSARWWRLNPRAAWSPMGSAVLRCAGSSRACWGPRWPDGSGGSRSGRSPAIGFACPTECVSSSKYEAASAKLLRPGPALFGSGKSPGQVSLRRCGGPRNRPLAAPGWRRCDPAPELAMAWPRPMRASLRRHSRRRRSISDTARPRARRPLPQAGLLPDARADQGAEGSRVRGPYCPAGGEDARQSHVSST